ncbi:hypothetical protein ABH931_006697 [Streptacidiphilus sp. MAP12-33]|uniref:hypothetical protein n=1 Tax=Streptacidiphilus sp. MAP12-33 TaxID=3156266 RepID=UPI0035191F73
MNRVGVGQDLLRWGGLAIGVVAAAWASGQGELGLGTMLAPTLLGLGAVLGALAADATAPRPTGTVRVAGLTPRRIRDFVPRRAVAALGVCAAVLVALLAVAGAVASPDDLGRSGRAFAYGCGDVAALRGPWPGFFYGVPLLAALAVAGTGSLLALRRIARRPTVDEAWRRAGASRVTAGWGLLVTASLAGVSLAMSGALSDLPCGGAGALDAASFGLGAVAVLSGAGAVACGVALCRRG